MVSSLVSSVLGAIAAVLPDVEEMPPADHRPWPPPSEPWIMAQRWEDLLFAHWPVPPEQLERLLPAALTLDTFDGTAWLGITPFRVTRVRLRGLPPVPFVSAFPEINVRTYVTVEDKPGVYFFSLDAGSAAAVVAARAWYRLPYFLATFSVEVRDGAVAYANHRERSAPPADFSAEYGPNGSSSLAEPGTLAWWLTERYCLYAVDGDDVYRAEIHHAPWPLQPAIARIQRNTMAAPLGLELPDSPTLVHFARELDVKIWRPHRLGA